MTDSIATREPAADRGAGAGSTKPPLPAAVRAPHGPPSWPAHWRLRAADPAALERLVRARNLSPVAATLLLGRGVDCPDAAARHLEPSLHHLHDPALLPGLAAASARVVRALERRETILVHGDYDVDGVTGTALLVRLLRHLGADVRWHVPNRFTDGYSFGDHSIERARETGATLVISVDNGTSARETITALAALGVDTIVTDHHEPPPGGEAALPPAVAIVNPKVARASGAVRPVADELDPTPCDPAPCDPTPYSPTPYGPTSYVPAAYDSPCDPAPCDSTPCDSTPCDSTPCGPTSYGPTSYVPAAYDSPCDPAPCDSTPYGPAAYGPAPYGPAGTPEPVAVEAGYPFRELCGGAVAFKLAWGVCQAVTGAERVRPDLRAFLVDAMAYVAIATVCDVVPLVDENRVLARYGLRALQATRDPGLRALLEVSGLAGRELTAEDVAFQIGPRINASGRLGSAETALRCLLAADGDEALRHATELDRLNGERRRLERELAVEAHLAAERFADRERWPVLVVAGQGWHQGVVGIVAARLVERFERPALVIGLDGAEGRGSARSVAGFDVLAALHGGAAHMLRYGGHAQAAGCEVRADAVDLLREAVCAEARALLAAAPPAARALAIDAELRFEDVTRTLMHELDRLAPWGQANEKPRFVCRDVRLAEPPRIVGADGTHLVLRLRRGEHVLKALAFGMAHRTAELELGAPLDAVFTPRWNTFRGETTLELELADFHAGAPEPGVRLR